jgi:polyhydroxybutyrate depolymerase
MDATADENGFIVCYPNGVDASWNVGWAFGSDADDVGFLSTLVDSLSGEYNIDQKRLYSCGMSNGGFMSYKLACEASDKFAAIASVTGSMVPSELAQCSPVRKIPVMQIHGTSDQTVAYEGSSIGAGIEEVVLFWAGQNNCNLTPEIIPVEDINTDDGCSAERIEYSDCTDDKEVVFYKIDGGAHTWPDAAITIGATNRDFNASLEIWNFFNRFDLNGVALSDENIVKTNYVHLFPNPVRDNITLSDLPKDVKEIIVVDAVGQTIISQIASDSRTMNMDVSSLETGLYFVIIRSIDSSDIIKFLKY